MNSNPEILAEMERAKKALKSAEVLLGQNLLEDCISRSYYAILHSAKAALLSKGISADSHDAIKNLFGMHLVKSGEIEKEYALIFREEQDERLLADYDVNFVPEQEMVFRRVEDARDFVSRIEKFLFMT